MYLQWYIKLVIPISRQLWTKTINFRLFGCE